MFIGGELIIGSIEVVLVFFDVGSEIHFEYALGGMYLCSLTMTVWSLVMLMMSVSPLAASFLLRGRFLTSTLILGVLCSSI